MTSPDDIQFPVARWSAWASGLQTPEAWRNWSGGLDEIRPGSKPDVKFLPPMFRRRISLLSRIALRVAYDCAGPEGLDDCNTVFASRYGEQEITLGLLKSVVAGEPLSPTHFSVSVHNVASGLFSIANRNRHSATALAAMEDTFSMGLLEAACQWRRNPERPVLFVMSDEPTPDLYRQYIPSPPLLYGVALLIDRRPDARHLPIASLPRAGRDARDTPPALRFLREFLEKEEPLSGDLAGGGIAPRPTAPPDKDTASG